MDLTPRQALDQLADETGENFTVADGLDAAIIGVGKRCGQPYIVVYDRNLCIAALVDQGMSPEDAEEYFEFNTAGAWMGPETPLYMERLPSEDQNWANSPAVQAALEAHGADPTDLTRMTPENLEALRKSLEVPCSHFDGETYEASRDHDRLQSQLSVTFNLMQDGKWRTLAEISEGTGYPQASVSARLRDLRKQKFGGHAVLRKHIDRGLFTYQLLLNTPED